MTIPEYDEECDCELCQSIRGRNALKKDGLKDDKRSTKSSGQQNHGYFSEQFSCPAGREVVLGAVTFPQWFATQQTLLTTGQYTTGILPSVSATLCVCHVPELSIKERCCVLDANNRVIMFLLINRERSAGRADQNPSESTSSTERSTGSERKTSMTKKGAGSSTREKKSKMGSG